jgi:acetyl-CoA carboxylase biotin carboxyl carrier protein
VTDRKEPQKGEAVPVSNEDIRSLIRIFDASDWQEMRVEVQGLKLVVSKTGALAMASHVVPTSPLREPAAPVAAPPPAPAASPPTNGGTVPLAPGQKAIKAPNLGTFWRQPKPGAPAYVEIGQLVDDDTTVCLIEVMKLFTPVKANTKGRIARICVEDGQMVEYDTPLFILDPA